MLPISFRVRAKFLAMVIRPYTFFPCTHTHTCMHSSDSIFFHFPPCSHFSSYIVSIQFFKINKHPPASRILPWLFPLPRTLFPQFIKWLTPSLLYLVSTQNFIRENPAMTNLNLLFFINLSELHFSPALSTAQHIKYLPASCLWLFHAPLSSSKY